MTAYEMVDGKYYEQGSEELEKANAEFAQEYPKISTERVLVKHFWKVRQHLERLVVLAGHQ